MSDNMLCFSFSGCSEIAQHNNSATDSTCHHELKNKNMFPAS